MACLARIAGTFARLTPPKPVLWPFIFQRTDQASARQLQGHVSLVQFRRSKGRRSIEFVTGGKNRCMVSRRCRIRTTRAGEPQLARLALGALRSRQSE